MGKKIKGRKRHILVDHLGLISKIAITAANYYDQNGLRVLINGLLDKNESVPKLVYADQGYAGGPLANWMRERDPDA